LLRFIGTSKSAAKRHCDPVRVLTALIFEVGVIPILLRFIGTSKDAAKSHCNAGSKTSEVFPVIPSETSEV